MHAQLKKMVRSKLVVWGWWLVVWGWWLGFASVVAAVPACDNSCHIMCRCALHAHRVLQSNRPCNGTSNPKPQTLNPKTQTSNPKPQTPNLKPQKLPCFWILAIPILFCDFYYGYSLDPCMCVTCGIWLFVKLAVREWS